MTLEQRLQIDLANEIINLVVDYNYKGLSDQKCIESIEVAAEKLRENE